MEVVVVDLTVVCLCGEVVVASVKQRRGQIGIEIELECKERGGFEKVN